MGLDLGVLSLCILFLCAALIFQMKFYQAEIQKLVDKLMSRSFHEYQSANTVTQPKAKVEKPPEIPEDLRVLQNLW